MSDSPFPWQPVARLPGEGRAVNSRVVDPLATLWGALWDSGELGTLARAFW